MVLGNTSTNAKNSTEKELKYKSHFYYSKSKRSYENNIVPKHAGVETF